jgi:hypothetical protein
MRRADEGSMIVMSHDEQSSFVAAFKNRNLGALLINLNIKL